MKLKRINRVAVIIAVFFILFAVNIAVAQRGPNLLESLRPLEGLNLAEAYETYWFVFDFVFALILFLGVTRGVLLQRFPGGPGAMIAGALSLFLAFGFIIGERRFNFRLFHLSPYILFFVIAMLIFVAFNYYRRFGTGGRLALGILLLVIVAIFSANPEMDALREYLFNVPVAGPWFSLLYTALWIIGVIMTGWGLVDLVRGWGGARTADTTAPAREGFHPIRRFRDWGNRRRETRDLTEEARILRELTNTIARMEDRYRVMVGTTMNVGVPINRAFQYYRGLGAAGLTPAQVAHLNANRLTLNNLHAAWVADWDVLINEIGRIATLSADLRNRVVYQLTRPI